MKRSYFQRIFNLSIYLLFSFSLFTVCSILLSFTIQSLQEDSYLSLLRELLQQIYIIVSNLSILSVVSFTFLIGFEIIKRIYQDNLVNLFTSIWQTFAMRTFLTQNEHSETVTVMNNTTVTRYNPINKSFNKMVKKTIVDIRHNRVILMIKLPNKQQAYKIWKDMEIQISEEIANRNPDFYFSPYERKGRYLLFVGTKRE